MASFGVTFQICISCYRSSGCTVSDFEGGLVGQEIEAERLGSQISSCVKFVYGTIRWNALGLGRGGNKGGVEEVLEGFALDPGQQPRKAHERGTLE